jgi:hypothetical protein
VSSPKPTAVIDSVDVTGGNCIDHLYRAIVTCEHLNTTDLETAFNKQYRAIAASTAPRVALEFKDCKPDDWLDWMTAGFENAVSASSKRPDELLMVKAVDEMSGGIAGCALWGWSPEVGYDLFPRTFIFH